MARVLVPVLLVVTSATSQVAPTPAPRTILVDSAADDRAPAWSPDGRWLAFESNRDGTWKIFVADRNGAGQRRVARPDRSGRSPAWSPAGDALVFVRTEADRSTLVVTRLADLTESTMTEAPDGALLFPHWSPDGRTIAFTREQAGRFRLEAVSSSGGTPRALLSTRPSARDLWPRWAPHGERLAFFSRRDDHPDDDEVYVDDLQGHLSRVTRRAGHDFTPAWSPDGSRLVVAVTGGDGPALAVVTLTGEVEARFACGFSAVTEPSWHPDGRSIAYAARAEARFAIYVEPHPPQTTCHQAYVAPR